MIVDKNQKIYIAGHKGMVGSAIWDALKRSGYTNLVGRKHAELDLQNQKNVSDFFETEKPDVVIDAAARVGGILANSSFPYTFLMENLQIQSNLMNSALEHDVDSFLFLGSSCIYPKFAPQPIKEEYLLTDALEPTNEWYAIAKISGVKACEAIRKQFNKNFFSLMPTNLYGPKDNFDLNTSHVLPAMLRKFHDAKMNRNETVQLWGTGAPLREFLHVDDMADAVVYALENSFQENIYNIGTGVDLTIRELAETIQKIVGHQGKIIWDSSKPDGTPRKLLDVSKMEKEGWKSKINLEDGIKSTYDWFLENIENYKEVKISN